MSNETSRKEPAKKIVFKKGDDDNVRAFRNIADEMVETYKRKNHDYGDSFGQSIQEWGPVAGLVRIQDKFNRAKNILMSERMPEVEESVVDTLTDLANYAIMLRMALTVQPVDFENVK